MGNLKKFGTDNMTTRAEIIAFQLVNNRGYDEAMNFIKTKLHFFHEEVNLDELSNSIEFKINHFKVSSEDINLLNNANQYLNFLIEIELEIYKYNQDIFNKYENS